MTSQGPAFQRVRRDGNEHSSPELRKKQENAQQRAKRECRGKRGKGRRRGGNDASNDVKIITQGAQLVKSRMERRKAEERQTQPTTRQDDHNFEFYPYLPDV